MLDVHLKIDKERRVVLTSSGHTALMTAYSILGSKRIVMPAYTFEATRLAATSQGIEVLIQDVDPHTGALSLEGLDPDQFDTMCVVCPMGAIPNLDSYQKYCTDNGKKLVIDGAATFGTPDISNKGDIFVHSMHATKTLCVGEGGFLICHEDLHKDAKIYLDFGLDKDKKPTGRGINGKISEYHCAVGLSLLSQIDNHIRIRRENASQYRDNLAESSTSFLHSMAGTDTCYSTLACYVSYPKETRRRLHDAGYETLAYYRPLESDYTVSQALYDSSICLPVHFGISSEDIDIISNIIRYTNG